MISATGPLWQKGYFIARKNRFVVTLQLNGTVRDAHLPNPGRLWEFVFPGTVFFVVPSLKGKLAYRVIGAVRDNHVYMLDTIQTNAIAEFFLKKGAVPGVPLPKKVQREVSFFNSRFDFFVKDKNGRESVIEVKSCSLVHQGVAMFPDAPSARALRHLDDLARLAEQGVRTRVLFLISGPRPDCFMPNRHTDPEYCMKMISLSDQVEMSAFHYAMRDPVTVDPESLTEVPVFFPDKDDCADKGAYLIIMKNRKPFSLSPGKLGQRDFPAGYYVYVGSARSGLKSRVSRHRRMRKKNHWHLDYICPAEMSPVRTVLIRGRGKDEFELAARLEDISDSGVSGFGASDSPRKSHLFFFNTSPMENRRFINTVLDFQTRHSWSAVLLCGG